MCVRDIIERLSSTLSSALSFLPERKARDGDGTLAEWHGAPPALVCAVPHTGSAAHCETLNRGGVGRVQHMIESLRRKKHLKAEN